MGNPASAHRDEPGSATPVRARIILDERHVSIEAARRTVDDSEWEAVAQVVTAELEAACARIASRLAATHPTAHIEAHIDR